MPYYAIYGIWQPAGSSRAQQQRAAAEAAPFLISDFQKSKSKIQKKKKNVFKLLFVVWGSGMIVEEFKLKNSMCFVHVVFTVLEG